MLVLVTDSVVELDNTLCGLGLLLLLGVVFLLLDLLTTGLLVSPKAGLEDVLDEMIGS